MMTKMVLFEGEISEVNRWYKVGAKCYLVGCLLLNNRIGTVKLHSVLIIDCLIKIDLIIRNRGQERKIVKILMPNMIKYLNNVKELG